MSNIEVEVQSFVSKERFEELIAWFRDNAELIKQDSQETYYFDCDADLRIQRYDAGSKLWLKSGDPHDQVREEIEFHFDREQFEDLEKFCQALGYEVEIKWFRERQQFDWEGIKVCLDHTRGYGYIIELEKLCSEDEKEQVLEMLLNKFDELGVALTPREEFEQKFQHYKKNWQERELF